MEKKKIFTITKDGLMSWRLGNLNSVKQLHFNKNITVNGLGGEHKPPVSRGIWAFPAYYQDYFFVYHKYLNFLPKNKEKDDEDWLKLAKKLLRPKMFYAKEFFSHVFPNGKTDYNDWFYWDSPKDWGKVAQKTLITYERNGNQIYKMSYTKDHLEIFVVV